MSQPVLLPPDAKLLPDGSKLGGWWHETEDGARLVCDLCPRACTLKPGDKGFCFVRENRDGRMVLSTYGRSTGFCIDPIEKKPLNHFYPGTPVLSFGTAGCNLGCKFCQNWSISKSREVARLSETATPEAIAEAAHNLGCRSVAFTYNDPVIWAEYAIDTARACRALGLKTVAVTAGYITEQARGPFYEAMDAANVDLKAFTEEFYQHLTLSHLQPVLDTLAWLKAETDVWFEITNLVIPRANDSPAEFEEMCQWVLEHVGDDVPIHFTAFHPDFRMQDRPRTPPETLLAAYDVARRAGLKYVYVGNVNDRQHQSTYCPGCGEVVIERDWYELGAYHLEGNRCGHCGTTVAGHFEQTPGNWGRKRQPVHISQYARPPAGGGEAEGTPIMTSPAQPTETAEDPVAPPPLSDAQQTTIVRAASELVTAAVCGRPPRISDPTLAGAAELPVTGCFLTIKRNGRLRACCGFVGRRATLREALEEASVSSATRDARLPAISPTELPFLDLHASLLYGLQRVTARGAERIGKVEVGRHGLRIARGESAGLLLPSVAVEGKLTAEQFLQHVCLKAGLPPTAWKEEDVQLATFEGASAAGPLVSEVLDADQLVPRTQITDDEVARLADFARQNLLALARGATPACYLLDCSDGNVQGVTLSIRLPGAPEAVRLAQLSIRPGVPLQATLAGLAQSALRALGAARLDDPTLHVDLTVLHDTAAHGTVADPDLRGYDPARRALLVSEGNRSAWAFLPADSPQQVLERAIREAEVRLPEMATVTSLHAVSTEAPLAVASIPRPQAGADARPPAVAGTFYPGDANGLAQLVDGLLEGPAPPRAPVAAAMVPHAGLIYSGRIAADVLRRIEIPETVIVIGPKHTRHGVEWAVAPHASWLLPGASVESDPQLARELAESIDGLQLDAAAHAREHAIEVELPLLARLAPTSRVVGIAVGRADLASCRRFAEGLAGVLRDRLDRTLLLISSDMNHFATDAENRRLDELALAAMETLDPARLHDTVRQNHISMCGVLPAVIVMETLRILGRLEKCERAGYATTADVSGDTSRVVGYAGMLLK